MNRIINYTISENDINKTIIIYLRERFYSSKMLTHLKHTDGAVLLNNVPVFMNTQLKTGDILQINYNENETSENIIPVNLPFETIFEDEDIIVINKPYDMPVHPAINNFDNTLANGLTYYFNSKGENLVFRCINRLDRNTSGLLVVAKNRLSASILSDFMKKRQIHREYLAVASGHFDKLSGTVDAPIGRVSDSIIERFVDYENGDTAVTHYEVVGEYVVKDGNRDVTCSLLKIKLDTGRTHQIRVHMKHIGHPLIGDTLYNKEPGPLKRQALHSHKLDFIHPVTLEKMHFENPLPEDISWIINA